MCIVDRIDLPAEGRIDYFVSCHTPMQLTLLTHPGQRRCHGSG